MQAEGAGARTVLVADDNADALDSLATFLELLGFRVLVARDGSKALELAALELPDIAILDLGMPAFDGWEVCRRLRCMAGGGDVVVVALSGWGSDEARRKSEDAGFDAHWTKPADMGQMLTLLRKPADNDRSA
jgi:CheY-like chemotaxis protein